MSTLVINENKPMPQPVDLPVSVRTHPENDPQKQNVSGVQKIVTQNPNKDHKTVDSNNLQKHTEQLNQVLAAFSRDIRFSVDDETDKTVVKVVDSNTGEVIRQIPPESMLKLMHRIEKTLGLILDEKV